MTERLIGETGSRKRRRFLLLPLLMVAFTALFMIAGAQAVHIGGGFELDRNATSSAAVPGEDWDVVYADTDSANASSFQHDVDGQTIFTGGGSKDDLNTTGWQHKTGSAPPKDELLDAFAARYGDHLYFGADRYSNSGDAVMGFWFFQNDVQAEADGTFGPDEHEDGDVLILSDFTGGGGNVTIRVFRWNGPGGSITPDGAINGTLDLIGGALETPADCVGPPSVSNTDDYCATVNTVATPSPWPFAAKTGPANSFPPGHLYEGGIDLGFLNLENECFASFLAETRSSTSVNAVLKDFVGGSFQPCESGLTTDASVNELDLGDSVNDTATLTASGSGAAPTGNIDFYVCGPSANISSCDANGTFLSSEDLAGATGTPPAYSVTSDNFTPVEVGEYCFFATYAGDSNYPPADLTDFSDECFEVNPNPTSISTIATAGPVSLGTAIDDVATLSGTAPDPDGSAADGTITFTAYGPFANTTTCTGTAVYTSVVNVSGDGDYTASAGNGGEFKPTAAGTYNWIAVYSGDSPNTPGVSGACGDANEGSVVEPNEPAISTNATADPDPVPLGTAIDDVATLSGTAPDPDGSAADGTITFTAYGPFANTTTCTGTAVYTSVVNVSGDGDYTASAGNGGEFKPTAAGTYNWIAVYSGDSPNTLGVSGACGDANEGSVVIALQPTISTAQSFVPNDEATITVAAGAGNLTGSVRFRLYATANCSGTALVDQTKPVSGDSPETVKTTNSTEITTTSTTLSWLVEYTSTNLGHDNVTSSCATENSSLTIDNG